MLSPSAFLHSALFAGAIYQVDPGPALTLERGIWYCDIPGDETKDGSPISFILPEENAWRCLHALSSSLQATVAAEPTHS